MLATTIVAVLVALVLVVLLRPGRKPELRRPMSRQARLERDLLLHAVKQADITHQLFPAHERFDGNRK